MAENQLNSAGCETSLENSLPVNRVCLQAFQGVLKDDTTVPCDDTQAEELQSSSSWMKNRNTSKGLGLSSVSPD